MYPSCTEISTSLETTFRSTSKLHLGQVSVCSILALPHGTRPNLRKVLCATTGKDIISEIHHLVDSIFNDLCSVQVSASTVSQD